MFPLWIFFLIWLVLVGLFCLMGFISVMQMLRYGIHSLGTTLSTFVFVVSSIFVIGGSGLFFLSTDLNQEINIFESLSQSINFDQTP